MPNPTTSIKLNVRTFKPTSLSGKCFLLHLEKESLEVEFEEVGGSKKMYYSNTISREGVSNIKCGRDIENSKWKVEVSSSISVDFYFQELTEAKQFKNLIHFWRYEPDSFEEYLSQNPFEPDLN